MSFNGGCRCGAVRYELTGTNPPLTYACHCLDCQTWSGSAFALHAIIGENDISISGGPHRFHLPEGTETMPSEHIGCETCFTRIANRNPALPGMMILRVGTLDESSEVVPAMHIWTRHKHRWFRIDSGTPAFPGSPTPEEFAAALAD